MFTLGFYVTGLELADSNYNFLNSWLYTDYSIFS